jgi:predicted AAA+ superfamily ATPase
MRFVERHLTPALLHAAKNFPAVVLTGPRRAGKTALLRRLRPAADYYLFEDPDIIARFRADPQGFLEQVQLPAIFDEIQNVPEVFNFVRTRIDRAPRRTGRWFLTGSQEAALMRGVSESMAGRAAVLELLPLSLAETAKVNLLDGGYPEVLARPRARRLWFSSYLQTYIERDVRSITAIRDLATFRRFFALVASRHGTVLNKTDLAAPLGMSVPAIGNWLDILEATAQVLLVQPYFDNLGKRIIKSPKLYISDSGLACHLLGIESRSELERSPFLGAIFEGCVASEIIKSRVNAGGRRQLFYFRDQQGLEVDFVVPGNQGGVTLVEAKAARSVKPAMAEPLLRLSAAWKKHAGPGRVEMAVVHRDSHGARDTTALAPGVKAVTISDFIAGVARPPRTRTRSTAKPSSQ